jgi:hypothetical protein
MSKELEPTNSLEFPGFIPIELHLGPYLTIAGRAEFKNDILVAYLDDVGASSIKESIERGDYHKLHLSFEMQRATRKEG